MKHLPAKRRFLQAFLCLCLAGGSARCFAAAEPLSLQLRPVAQVDGEGIFLSQLVQTNPALPQLRLADAPLFGKTTNLSRAQIVEMVRTALPDLALTNFIGAAAVRIDRRSRPLAEAEALQWLTAALQEQYVKEKGELELRFSRPWTTLSVPDEPLTLKVLDLPSSGVTASFIARFELVTARGERSAPSQAVLQARVWREVWVARSTLKRGDSPRNADIARERRDVLPCREALAEFAQDDSSLEIAESVSAGLPLLARAVRFRPVVHRGQTIAALLQDGTLAITLKVEALEEGAPGQIIRLRNPISRRDLRGKVVDEKTILVTL